ncbi:MAG: hypothetical protein QF363_07090, partial [Planctomycetaceae bacterium]|nr:hypothetical protein [Planctomycetaceae bacterium]
TDKGLPRLTPLKLLIDLPVRGTRVTFAGVMDLFTRHQRRDMSAALRAMGLAPVDGPIRRLDLVRTGIRDEDLALLKDLPHLEQLVLTNTGITDAGLKHVGRLQRLKGLYIAKCSVTDEGIASLAGLRKLESLNLYGTQVGDKGLGHLHKMKQLRDLYLTDLKLSPKALAALKQALPDVTVAGP